MLCVEVTRSKYCEKMWAKDSSDFFSSNHVNVTYPYNMAAKIHAQFNDATVEDAFASAVFGASSALGALCDNALYKLTLTLHSSFCTLSLAIPG